MLFYTTVDLAFLLFCANQRLKATSYMQSNVIIMLPVMHVTMHTMHAVACCPAEIRPFQRPFPSESPSGIRVTMQARGFARMQHHVSLSLFQNPACPYSRAFASSGLLVRVLMLPHVHEQSSMGEEWKVARQLSADPVEIRGGLHLGRLCCHLPRSRFGIQWPSRTAGSGARDVQGPVTHLSSWFGT
jgi:hypothetical protein